MDMKRDEEVTAGELYNRAMISKQDLQAEHAGESARLCCICVTGPAVCGGRCGWQGRCSDIQAGPASKAREWVDVRAVPGRSL